MVNEGQQYAIFLKKFEFFSILISEFQGFFKDLDTLCYYVVLTKKFLLPDHKWGDGHGKG